jgi:hypothetical protein
MEILRGSSRSSNRPPRVFSSRNCPPRSAGSPHTVIFLECECGAILGQAELFGIAMVEATAFRGVRCADCDRGSAQGQAIAARLERGRTS